MGAAFFEVIDTLFGQCSHFLRLQNSREDCGAQYRTHSCLCGYSQPIQICSDLHVLCPHTLPVQNMSSLRVWYRLRYTYSCKSEPFHQWCTSSLHRSMLWWVISNDMPAVWGLTCKCSSWLLILKRSCRVAIVNEYLSASQSLRYLLTLPQHRENWKACTETT